MTGCTIGDALGGQDSIKEGIPSWLSLASQAARSWANFMYSLCEEVECSSELASKQMS